MAAIVRASVLIVGAATPVGRSVAEAFADQGAELLLTDVVSGHLAEVVESIAERTGTRPAQQILRVTDPEEWIAALDHAERLYGRVDFVVNAAEYDPGVAWLDASAEDWSRATDINLQGVVHGLTASLPVLERVAGCFVLVVSEAADPSQQVLRAVSRSAAVTLAQLVQKEMPSRASLVTVRVPVGSESLAGARIVTDLLAENTQTSVERSGDATPT